MAENKSEQSPNEENAQGKGLPEDVKGNEFYELIKIAFWAVLLATIIRSFLYEPFNIPSSSMKPTLLIGDYLFVSKPSYGYSKYSFPFSPDIIEGRIWGDDKPQRGDVIVFRNPQQTNIDYIKRVVAMPGETVQMQQGRLYINDELVKRDFVKRLDVDESGAKVEMLLYKETLPGGTEHFIYEETDNGALDNTGKFTVPEGHYFMMGDNRDNSQDSRVTQSVGPVPLENMIGKANIVFFSTNGTAHLWEIWKWPFATRFSRLFSNIHAEIDENSADKVKGL
jgi:signal peptidase I